METFEIKKEERTELLKYMWRRPYGEVAQLIAILAGLKPLKGKKNGKETNTSVGDPTSIVAQCTMCDSQGEVSYEDYSLYGAIDHPYKLQ